MPQQHSAFTSASGLLVLMLVFHAYLSLMPLRADAGGGGAGPICQGHHWAQEIQRAGAGELPGVSGGIFFMVST